MKDTSCPLSDFHHDIKILKKCSSITLSSVLYVCEYLVSDCMEEWGCLGTECYGEGKKGENWINHHNEEFHNVYFSRNVIRTRTQ